MTAAPASAPAPGSTLRAALWMTGAIASFSSMAVAGRAVSAELDTFEIMLYRSILGFAVVVAVARAMGRLGSVRSDRLGLHGLRNLAHFAGQNLWFYSLTVIPLAQVFALEFTAPLWVVLLAPLLLGERITRRGLLAALLGFAGILIVARPDPAALSPGVVTAALAAVGFALTALFTRRLTRHESITSILFWLTLLQSGMGLVAAGLDGDIAWPSMQAMPWLLLISAAGLLAHLCLTSALAIAPAGIVMTLDFARLPVIAIVGALFYEEAIDLLVFLGAAVILAANWLNLSAGRQPAR